MEERKGGKVGERGSEGVSNREVGSKRRGGWRRKDGMRNLRQTGACAGS